MEKRVNINATEWCDMVFDGKNKSYGAYKLRQSSGKRHLVAFGCIVLLMAIISCIPTLVNTVQAANKARLEGVDGTYTIVDIVAPKEVEVEIPETVIEPPELIVNSVAFTPPVIVPNDEVTADNQLKTVDDVLSTAGIVGRFDVTDGSNSINAISMDELRDNYKVVETVVEDKIHITAEVMPQYLGGEQEMYRYIGSKLSYPTSDQENGIQGRVTIRFVVTKDGSISNVSVLKGISPNCDREAIRVVKSMPKWVAGKQNGNPVSVFYTIPIVFKLQN